MHTTALPVNPPNAAWSGLVRRIFMPFMLLAHMQCAQAATDLIANNSPLPLRNVLIEVRQVQQTQTQNSGAQLSGSVGAGAAPWDPAHLQAHQNQNQRAGTTTQQVLVLNGRSARVAISTQVPLRVLQTYIRNGTLVAVPGTLALEAGTGFSATPRWNGSEVVELEISAAQTLGSGHTLGGGQNPHADATPSPSATARSMLAVPLDTWVTVAESDAQSGGTGSSLGGQGQWSEQANSSLQVRLTLR
jgi:hypothetical protein